MSYERIPNNLDGRGAKLTDFDVRKFAYWSLLAGACGHTYGANEVWMMWSPEIEPISPAVKPPFSDYETLFSHPATHKIVFHPKQEAAHQ